MATPDPLTTANEHLAAGRYAQSEQTLLRLIRREPRNADALDALGMCYAAQQFRDRALYYFKLALQARPDDVHIALHVGELHRQLLNESEAADAVLPFVKKNPTDTIAACFAANMLLDSKRLVECERVITNSLKHAPDQPSLRHVQARYLQRIGDSSAACRTLKALAKTAPNEDGLHLSLATSLNYDHESTPRDQYLAHMAFGRSTRLRAAHDPYDHPPTDDPHRKLRIGFISPDLRAHSVAFFIEPLLEQIDREHHSVHCYYTRDIIDSISDRLRKKADSFVVTVRADAVQLAKKICADKIDILIELCGLFSGNSLSTMQLQPAPVQATFIGYPNTTGISTIGYRIVDSTTDPESPERYTSEKLARLDPCFLCYKPDEAFLRVDSGKPEREGPFTFGSFNAAMKLCDSTLQMWSAVLQGSPGSRLLVKASGMEEPAVRDSLRSRMALAGIDLERAEIVGRTPTSEEHLNRYGDIDLALDTFPYNGTTTTCEALLMGVPVLTLTGATHASRVGASLLNAAGLDGFVCATPGEYTAKACGYAANRATLTPHRAGLRERLLASPLCDSTAYTRRFERLLRQMWHERCGHKDVIADSGSHRS